MGVNKKNIVIANIGDVISLDKNFIKIAETVPSGSVLVDGLGIGDVGSVVLRDRKHLADDGILVVAIAMDSVTNEVVSGPDIISRGFVYVKESEELIDNATEAAERALEFCYLHGIYDRGAIKNKVKDSVSKFIFDKTRRRPMVLPVIMDI